MTLDRTVIQSIAKSESLR